MTTNFYGPGVAISYSLLAVLYLVLLILEIAFLLFKFYQNKPNWFKKKKQNTTFSSSFSSSESSSSGGGGGGTLVFVDNKSSSTTTFADSLPFYLLLLPATFGLIFFFHIFLFSISILIETQPFFTQADLFIWFFVSFRNPRLISCNPWNILFRTCFPT